MHHRLARFAAECLLEFRHVGERTIHAELGQGMLVACYLQARKFRALVSTPTEGEAQEEPLPGRQSISGRRVQRFALVPVKAFQREPSKVNAAVIGGILTGGQIAVLLYSVLRKFLRVLVHNALVFFFILPGASAVHQS